MFESFHPTPGGRFPRKDDQMFQSSRSLGVFCGIISRAFLAMCMVYHLPVKHGD